MNDEITFIVDRIKNARNYGLNFIYLDNISINAYNFFKKRNFKVKHESRYSGYYYVLYWN